MSFGGGGGGGISPHVHNNVPLQGGPLDFANDTIASLTAGSTTFSDGAALQELLIGTPSQALVVNSLGTAPEWAAAGFVPNAIPLRSLLPREGVSTDPTVALDQIYRMGELNWKVTQIEKPIKFEGQTNASLSAISDDMTGYSSDAEFDAVWVTSDGTNLNPDAAQNRIDGIIANGSDAACVFDIGHTIEYDSVFTLIFSMQVPTSGAGNKKWFMGLSSTTGDFTDTQDAVGFHVGNDNMIIQCGAVNNNSLDQVSATDGNFAQLADSTNRYFVINGLGFGRFSCTMYDSVNLGKNYETETQTYTWSSAPSGMRYIKVALWSKATGTSTTFNISNVMFLESDHPMAVFNK